MAAIDPPFCFDEFAAKHYFHESHEKKIIDSIFLGLDYSTYQNNWPVFFDSLLVFLETQPGITKVYSGEFMDLPYPARVYVHDSCTENSEGGRIMTLGLYPKQIKAINIDVH